MHIAKQFEFPKRLQLIYKKAIRYQWISLFYMISVVLFLSVTMGQSQTMKVVWFEDMLSLLPPAVFLLSSKIIKKPPNEQFPYGYHKVVGISFLASALILTIVGTSLFIDSFIKLFKLEHPDVPMLFWDNYSLWLGYLMMLALLWKSIPNTFLGHIKYKLALRLYDKILLTDSKMNKADWMTGLAGIIGIWGIGFGFWWMDSTIAILISLEILHDGFRMLKESVLDLIDQTPHEIDKKNPDPIVEKVKNLVKKQRWVKNSFCRFRDDGHVFFGEIFIIPNTTKNLVQKVQTLEDEIKALHWRMHDIVITLKNAEV